MLATTQDYLPSVFTPKPVKPDAPTAVAAQRFVGAAVVNWTAPVQRRDPDHELRRLRLDRPVVHDGGRHHVCVHRTGQRPGDVHRDRSQRGRRLGGIERFRSGDAGRHDVADEARPAGAADRRALPACRSSVVDAPGQRWRTDHVVHRHGSPRRRVVCRRCQHCDTTDAAVRHRRTRPGDLVHLQRDRHQRGRRLDGVPAESHPGDPGALAERPACGATTGGQPVRPDRDRRVPSPRRCRRHRLDPRIRGDPTGSTTGQQPERLRRHDRRRRAGRSVQRHRRPQHRTTNGRHRVPRERGPTQVQDRVDRDRRTGERRPPWCRSTRTAPTRSTPGKCSSSDTATSWPTRGAAVTADRCSATARTPRRSSAPRGPSSPRWGRRRRVVRAGP